MRLKHAQNYKNAAITGKILSASFEVSNVLGAGFLEKVYHQALLVELRAEGLAAEAEVAFPVIYKNNDVGRYIADIVVERCVIVEVKALAALYDAHVGQTVNYLRASNCVVGLLLNFGQPKLQYRRLVV